MSASRLRQLRVAALLVAVVASACSKSHAGGADAGSPDLATAPITLSVGADTSLVYASGFATLPDEHTSFLHAGPSATGYLAFAASSTAASGGTVTGALALDTSDLVHFTPASGYGSAALGGLVFAAPSSFVDCAFTGAGSFDQNYAAPGSVLADPTLPAGNLLMVYEAEQHCFGGKYDFNFFASIGFARSSDDGKTWPAPGAPGRYAILQVPGAKPTTTPVPPEGDAIPTAFIDDVAPGHFLYVVYENTGAAAIQPDGFLRVARAQLGQTGPLAFTKWHQGGWSQPGLGGLDSAITPQRGCGASGYQDAGQISYVEPLRLYLLTFVCVKLQQTSPGNYSPFAGSWYFSTATSLALQDWSVPQSIEGSAAPVAPAPTSTCANGADFDGWYPSFVTPGLAAGHLGRTGLVFYLKGCNGGSGRAFTSRTFTLQ
jgi:hypothetical protein